MTAQNHEIIPDEPEDELLAHWLLNQMVQEDRWELTDLGREYLREARAEQSEILESLQDRDARRVSNILSNR